jgi:hypothetical protein
MVNRAVPVDVPNPKKEIGVLQNKRQSVEIVQ